MNEQLELPLKGETTRLFTWGDVEQAVTLLADEIKLKGVPKGLIAVARGGSIFTVLLSEMLGLPILGTIHANSYKGRKQADIIIRQIPCISTDKVRDCLVVDDLVDSGGTIKAISSVMPSAVFVTAIGKPTGLSFIEGLLYVAPPIVVSNTCWITFPWEKYGN